MTTKLDSNLEWYKGICNDIYKLIKNYDLIKSAMTENGVNPDGIDFEKVEQISTSIKELENNKQKEIIYAIREKLTSFGSNSNTQEDIKNKILKKINHRLEHLEKDNKAGVIPPGHQPSEEIIYVANKYNLSLNNLDLNTYKALLPLTLEASKNEQATLPAQEQKEIAILHAIKLAILFGNEKLAKEYLERYKKRTPDSKQLVHDACLFSLPSGDQWNITLWREMLKKQKPSSPRDMILRLLPMAENIQAYAIENSKPMTPNTPSATLLDYAKQKLYKHARDNPEAARLFFDLGIEEKYFDQYIELKPQDDSQFIPDISIDGSTISESYKDYVIKKLSPFDPQAAVLGKLTSCCQTLGDQGASPAIHGITNPRGGFYVLCEKKGIDKKELIVAQCWAWRGQDESMVFDSIESQLDFRNKNKRLISDFFVELANELVQTKVVNRVLVGGGGETPKEVGPFNEDTLVYPVEYFGYRDSAGSQRLVADKNLPLVESYMQNNNSNTKLVKPNKLAVMDLKAMKKWCNLCLSQGKEDYLRYLEPYLDNGLEKQEIETYILLMKKWISLLKSPLNIEELKELIEKGMDPNFKTVSTDPVLLSAIKERQWELVNYLLDHGANVNIRDKYGLTSLHYLISQGEFDKVYDLILNRNADITAEDGLSDTPLAYAVTIGNLELAKWLVQHEAVSSNSFEQFQLIRVLRQAIDYGHFDFLQWLIEKKQIDINSVNEYGLTMLHFAAAGGKLKIVQWLLEQGANINCVTNDNVTPLHFAAKNNKIEIVQYLVNNGATIDIKDKNGKTPRESTKDEKIIKILEETKPKLVTGHLASQSLFKPTSPATNEQNSLPDSENQTPTPPH